MNLFPTLPPIPRRRLLVIILGLLLNSVIFSAGFSFFTSFNDFSTSYLGGDPDTVIIYTPQASTIFTGTVPSYLSDYLTHFDGVKASNLEVLAQTVTLSGEIVTVRGVEPDFFDHVELKLIDDPVQSMKNGCLIGSRCLERLELEVGDRITLRGIYRNTIQDVVVQGVYYTGTPLDDEIIVPIRYARSLRGINSDSATLIRVKIDRETISEERLKQILQQRYNLTVSTSSQTDEQWVTSIEVKQEGVTIQKKTVPVPGETSIILPIGEYEIAINNMSKPIILEENKTIHFNLAEKLYEVKLNVINSADNEPIEGAEVLFKDQFNRTWSYESDRLGEITAYLPSGVLELSLRHMEHQRKTTLNIDRDIKSTITLGYIPLKIQILDGETHQPLPSIELKIAGDSQYSGITDERGIVEQNLPEGLYNISVDFGEYVDWRLVQLIRGTNLVFSKGYVVTYDLKINAVWSNSTPVKNAVVTITGDDYRFTANTNHQGMVEFISVPEGAYSLHVEKAGLTHSSSLVLDIDKIQSVVLPSPSSFEPKDLSPQWVRYLPQSITLRYADRVFNEATRQIVDIIKTTVFVLAFLLCVLTTVNSIDIIQNMINETSKSIGVLRSLGASREDTLRIFSLGILLQSIVIGVLGYLIGYTALFIISERGLLTLSGYTLLPHLNLNILLAAVLQSLLVTGFALMKSLSEVNKLDIMTLLKGLRRQDIIQLPRSLLIPLLAFLVPFTVRAIPEIITWPLPIGYDTISAYIPTLVALKSGYEIQVFDFINQRPFFWVIYSLPYPFDEIMPFKTLPVLMHGFLGLTIYGYIKQVSKNNGKALISALISTLYFVSLRISWDLYGNEMGLALLFLSLMYLEKGVDKPGNAAVAFLSILGTVLTHEAASILLFLSITPLLVDAVKKRENLATWGVIFMVPLVFFIYRLRVLDFPLIMNALGSYRYPSDTVTDLTFSTLILYAYTALPLIPAALFGIKTHSKYHSMRVMFLGATIAAFSPIYSPTQAIAFWTRWVYMSTYPLTIFAVEGLYQLSKYNVMITPIRTFNLGKTFGALFILATLAMSLGFLTIDPEVMQPYQNLFGGESDWIVHHIPSSMQLSTISPREAGEAVNGILLLNRNAAEAVLLVDEEVRGFAALYCDKDKILVHDLGPPWYSNPDYIKNTLSIAEKYHQNGQSVYFVGRTFYVNELTALTMGEEFQLYRYNPQ